MSKLINNPHDKVFKKVLSQPKLAQRFFKQHLPQDMQDIVELEHLCLQKGSFVDEKLKEHLTDLLYSVPLKDGNPGYVYLLLESQSTTDELMAFRLLRYTLDVMEQHMAQNKSNRLPLVLPLVYYIVPERKLI